MKAVVLLSGGLDSATTLAIALDRGYEVYALSFDYGQRHSKELKAVENITKHYNIKSKFMKIPLNEIGGSALTDKIDIPINRNINDEIPITYVPARNTILLSFALAYAETTESNDIFIGANAIDFSGYPDCRPEYFEAFEKLCNLATKRGVEGNPVKIHTPLLPAEYDAGILWCSYHANYQYRKILPPSLLLFQSLRWTALFHRLNNQPPR